MTEPVTLRERQIAALERMLHLNKDGEADLTLASKNEEIVWKVLVMDKKSQAVISSVLRVNDLLRCGVTVHTSINSARAALPDVPAIYFVEATRENVSKILDDLAADKYESYYINFTASVPRDLLEEFAKKVSLCGKGSRIRQVYDQYLDFIVTEPNLFLLDERATFAQFNAPGASEDAVHAVAGRVADGLLAALVTMNCVPIIRCPKHGPAELVATELDTRLRDHVANSRGFASTAQAVVHRPVLVLLDRNIDLAAMFSHSWIYQCMVSDVFELRRNTIRVPRADGSGAKSYDVDPRDFFWNKNALLPFPDVVENADVELGLYKKDAHDLTARTGVSSLDDLSPDSATDTSSIQHAVEAIPELTARKATLDMHMDVLASLLKELEARSLDRFFEIEQSFNDPKLQAEFLELLRADSKHDNSLDKYRTLLILCLLADLPTSFVDDCRHVLSEKYPHLDMRGFNYIQSFKQMSRLSHGAPLSDNASHKYSSADGNTSALFTGLSSKLYGFTEGRISTGISSLASGLKRLLPEKKNLPITNVVEAIVDPDHASTQSMHLTDDYIYLDPRSRGGHSKPPKRNTYDDAIVFVVGGGNYLEYQNLFEWANHPNRPHKNIVYGSTDIVTAKDFLQEILQLGA